MISKLNKNTTKKKNDSPIPLLLLGAKIVANQIQQ